MQLCCSLMGSRGSGALHSLHIWGSCLFGVPCEMCLGCFIVPVYLVQLAFKPSSGFLLKTMALRLCFPLAFVGHLLHYTHLCSLEFKIFTGRNLRVPSSTQALYCRHTFSLLLSPGSNFILSPGFHGYHWDQCLFPSSLLGQGSLVFSLGSSLLTVEEFAAGMKH